MPKTVRRASDDHTTLTDAERADIEQYVRERAAKIGQAVQSISQVPDHAVADSTATSSPDTPDPTGGNRAARRARHPQISSTLARDIARRNRKQLAPHAVTAGLVALAQTIHYAAAQAHLAGIAALATGAACATVGTVGWVWLRKRGLLARQWSAWAAVAATASSLWMVLAVTAGVSWGSLAAALTAEYALGCRWWKHHRHPQATEPAPEPADEPATTVDDSLITAFTQRWTDNIGCQGGPLPGSALIYSATIEHGIEYTLRLQPGKQYIDMVQANLKAIASGLKHPETRLTVEPYPGNDRSLVTLRIITSSPVEDTVYFRGPEFTSDGHIVLGPYADGIGHAVWRLYSDNSMWGGMLVGGTGSGKSRLLEVIALCALYTGMTYVIHVDGQDGASCPTLWDHAQERYGPDEVDQLLDRLEAMMLYRQKHGPQRGKFNPTPDYPGVLVPIDETNAILTRDNATRFAALARRARKVGIGIVMADQDASLETFIKGVLRGNLRKGNAVGMKTDERSQGQIFTNGKFNLADLPEIPGFGHTLGDSARHAPYRGRFAPDAEDDAKASDNGEPLPEGLSLIEEWYASAPTIPLDAGTYSAGGTPSTESGTPAGHAPDGAAPTRPRANSAGEARLTAMPLPTVGTAEPESPKHASTGEAPELTDSQYAVLDAITLGLSTPQQVADQLAISRRRVSTVLGSLVDRGLVTKSGAGKSVTYTAIADQQAV